VGLCAERSVEMMVGLLAILKAGGAYVPLDPRQPTARLSLLLEETCVPVLLTQGELLARLPATAARVLCLDADRASVESESAENPVSTVSPGNLAYIIYTSGSTGRPKGVMVQHRSVVNLIAALREAVYKRHAPDDAPLHVSLNAPLVFDASVKQLVQLLEGHALHIIPDAARADAGALLTYARRQRLDVLDCTPSQLRLLLAVPEEELKALPRVLLVGGEALDEATWARLAARESLAAYNVYGPTECTVDATVAPVRAGEAPSIGRAVANARTYILDERMRPVPVGASGELYIGGEGLARGYFARPDLTAERFTPDPFAVEPGARLYRTGDLARYRADGCIEYLGRADDQVKLRGYRVELGEIEAVLRSCEGVRECVAVVREETNGDARLVAYLTAETRGAGGERAEPPSVARVREQARARLPEYMIPSAFVVLEKMPLTPNGKVDRRALPAPDSERPETGVSYVAPRDRIEETVARIWQEVLGVERVGAHDNFFDLGGHSLLMVQVHSRLRETFRKEIAMVELFRHPTVGTLARHLADEPGHQTSFRKTYDRASRRREAANRQTRMKEDKSDD
ncbi:MAG: non-ribosomal peptide synthetase, partial [Pyrinomonadaceae bacterium]